MPPIFKYHGIYDDVEYVVRTAKELDVPVSEVVAVMSAMAQRKLAEVLDERLAQVVETLETIK